MPDLPLVAGPQFPAHKARASLKVDGQPVSVIVGG